MKELRDKLADNAHESWSGWMRYLFSNGVETRDGFTIPPSLVHRWKRQMTTPFSLLTDSERGSGYDEADMILKLIEDHNSSFIPGEILETDKRIEVNVVAENVSGNLTGVKIDFTKG